MPPKIPASKFRRRVVRLPDSCHGYRPDRPSDPTIVWFDESVEMTDDRLRAVAEIVKARKK